MAFSTFSFIFVFLPAALAAYYLLPRKHRNLVLLTFSLLFYSWGAPAVLVILIGSSFVDYQLSRQIMANRKRSTLLLAVGLNILILAYYKYSNFTIEQLNLIRDFLGQEALPWAKVILPAGISFFTFEKISYLVDVYRGTATPARTFKDYLLFVSLFPHLIAGPILKYHDLYQQIVQRQHSWPLFQEGWIRFCFGLAKKVLIADELGRVADHIFGMNAAELSAPVAWLGALCYAMQIYFDFSGYSDMAIGMGKMFGFRLIENFNWPYISQSITEFWRRWHISLGNWMREYLYIPLGGNRCSVSRSYLNLVIVFFLSGLWHGASWTYILWGIYHGLFLVIDRMFWLKISARIPKFVNIILIFIIVVLGWVLFRATSIEQATAFYAAMLGLNPYANFNMFPLEVIHPRGLTIFCLAMFTALIGERIFRSTLANRIYANEICRKLIFPGLALIGLLLATVGIAANGYSAFLYYQF